MGCTGACCVVFPLSTHPGEWLMDGGNVDHPGNCLEMLTILGMVEPLTTAEARERRERFGVEQPIADETSYFKCRHWDEDTRLCGNYDGRPWMCRTYPHSGSCEHGCSCVGELMIVPLYTRHCLGVREMERDRRLRAAA